MPSSADTTTSSTSSSCWPPSGSSTWPSSALRRSPFGRVLRAIREDETVAAVAGKPVFRFKVQAFALGAGVAGLAGILFAHYLAYIEPNMFLPQESLFVWLALILGGSGNNRGALLGSAVLRPPTSRL